MTFEELEQIRENYNKKRRESCLKVVRIVAIIYAVFIALILLERISSTAFSEKAQTSSFMFDIIPISIHFLIIGFIAATIYTSIKTSGDAKVYKNAYKYYFITSTFQKIFTDLVYSHETGMPYATIAATGMMNMGDRYSSNDYTSAKYKGIPFEQADVHIEEEHTDSDGDRTFTTIFRGRYVVFDLKKNFTKKLFVASKNFYAYRYDKSFQKTELESMENSIKNLEFMPKTDLRHIIY